MVPPTVVATLEICGGPRDASPSVKKKDAVMKYFTCRRPVSSSSYSYYVRIFYICFNGLAGVHMHTQRAESYRGKEEEQLDNVLYDSK